MPKTPKKNQKNNKYNAENEIIIGVTTKPKEKVRVDNKKDTRTKSIVKNKKNSKEKKDQTVKNIKKDNNKIKRKNRKKFLISICILFIIIAGGTIYCLTTPIFNIQNINVLGNEKISKDTYISLSGINIGSTNIFAISKNNIDKKIKENSYVNSVDIKRKLPNTIEIYVTERNINYQIEYHGNYIYMDEQGYILEINENKKDVPIIKGLSSIQGDIIIGERCSNEDLQKLDTVLKIINYCKYNSIENTITSIDVSDTSNYILDFEKDKKKAYLGDASNLSERILWLKTILKKEKDNSGKIFINGDLNNGKVYFREE